MSLRLTYYELVITQADDQMETPLSVPDSEPFVDT